MHLNHAGASPSPPSVVQTVVDHLRLEQTLGGYAAEQAVSDELQRAYQHVADLLGPTTTRQEIALVESATVAWTRLFYAMIDLQDKQQHQHYSSDQKTKVILVSQAEYAAQIVAAIKVAQEARSTPSLSSWTVRSIPTLIQQGNTGTVDVAAFEELLRQERPGEVVALVCVTHVPTNSGIVNPVEAIGSVIARHNNNHHNNELYQQDDTPPKTLYLVDACQSIGQMPVRVKDLQCHGLCGTGRKYLRGPRGTGFLYVPQHICELLIPSQVDHSCAPIARVPKTLVVDCEEPLEDIIDFGYKEGAARFEYWESSIANKLGLGEAARYAVHDIGLDTIQTKIQQSAVQLKERLRRIEQVKIHHDSALATSGIVTFAVTGMNASDVKAALWLGEEEGGAGSAKYDVSVVPATSTPLDSARLQLPDLVRASVSYTTTIDEIESFCHRLDYISHANTRRA